MKVRGNNSENKQRVNVSRSTLLCFASDLKILPSYV